MSEFLLSIYHDKFQPLAVAIDLSHPTTPQLLEMLQVLENAAPVGKFLNTSFIAAGDKFRPFKDQGVPLAGAIVAACFRLEQPVNGVPIVVATLRFNRGMA